MSMTYEDWASELAISDIHTEEVMKQATKAQCIYLFVEGDSEERAFPILIEEAGFDLEKVGVIVANYNGFGNLKHSLRLLNKTLSHDRPVIVTIDNDEDGAKTLKQISGKDYTTELINIFPVPSVEKVTYRNGHKGGSFEEIFTAEHFINCCFSEKIMKAELLSLRTDFDKTFDEDKPWYDQVKKFCALNGFTEFSYLKADLAEYLAEECDDVPETILELVDFIKDIRAKYPVKHPDDVELPKILGLTYFPKEKS